MTGRSREREKRRNGSWNMARLDGNNSTMQLHGEKITQAHKMASIAVEAWVVSMEIGKSERTDCGT